jgi:hypothetical protein
MALGDLFYEARGKITSQRVLDIEGPKIETTLLYDGTMKSGGSSIEVVHIATFTSRMRDGAFFSEGTGVITAKHGSGEMATELGRGITRFVEGGKKVVGRGLFIFNTRSKTGNLGFLNNLTGVLENEADEAGNSMLKVWEWK